MKLEDITKEKEINKERREIQIPIRATKSESKWMKEKKISPTKLFRTALKEVGYKE